MYLNLIVLGSGKTTFCQLMSKVYSPFCPEIIDIIPTTPTDMCKVYRLQHTVFSAVYNMNLIDTPHVMSDISRSFLTVVPTYLVYLFDLSKQSELDGLYQKVRESNNYYDCDKKIFIGVNRCGKTISDIYINTIINTFSMGKYLEIDLRSEDGKFNTTELIDTFNILTQYAYTDDAEDEDELFNDFFNEEDHYSYTNEYIEIAQLLTQINDIVQPKRKIIMKNIMKNSKFVTSDYFERKKDTIKCCICFDDVKTIEQFVYTWCGHEYCVECYPKMEECFCKTVVES